MADITLEDFEDFYKKRLNNIYFKEKKFASKLISDIRENLISIKISMDHFLEVKEALDQKALKSLNFFSDRIKKEIDEIEIPDNEITHDNLISLFNAVKKLFITINDIAKKSLPKFQKEVQTELKELNYLTRKLNKKQINLDQFIRNKYSDVKSAEDILGKIPKFYNLRENIENTKKDIEIFETNKEEIQENLDQLNDKLLEIEKDDLFKQLKTFKDLLFKIKMEINNELGFKKALKKLKVEVERNNLHIQNLDDVYIREFIKDPIYVLSKEGKELNKFKSLLIQLRHTLEENKLNLKTDKKEKTIEQINNIFNDKKIYEDLDRLHEIREKTDIIKNEIEKKGLDQKQDVIKNDIALKTQRLEHLENDIKKKNHDYLRYLGTLKKEREDFQKIVEDIIGEEFKLNITISF
ncbi:MAG: hypothetical protein JXA99_07645 [Candidatus Lokiarchaeota archaeon]|nr:hypothetical protein [Candidatus Lokiarchaeota archaeon]